MVRFGRERGLRNDQKNGRRLRRIHLQPGEASHCESPSKLVCIPEFLGFILSMFGENERRVKGEKKLNRREKKEANHDKHPILHYNNM